MDHDNRSYADIIKDNVQEQWEQQRPKDARDWIHLITDGWLEPFDNKHVRAPFWLLAGLAAFIVTLYLIW
ncbi:MAG: hypothetical protein AAF697_11325 [Pseudomonadota bacterium]